MRSDEIQRNFMERQHHRPANLRHLEPPERIPLLCPHHRRLKQQPIVVPLRPIPPPLTLITQHRRRGQRCLTPPRAQTPPTF